MCSGRAILLLSAFAPAALAQVPVAPAATAPPKPPPPRTAPPGAANPGAPTAVEGHVLAIVGGDLIVDLATKDGLVVGDELELWRPLKLVHPVTRKIVVDRYRIGTLRVTQVRPAIALARLDGTPLREAEVADVVIAPHARPLLGASAPTAGPPAPSSSTASMPIPPAGPPGSETEPATPAGSEPASRDAAGAADPDVHAVAALFDGLRGASLTTRIHKYERYARGRPDSRFARVLLEEAAALRELVSAREKSELDVPTARHFDAPSWTLDQTPLTLAVEVGGRAVGAMLQARNAGEVAYQPLPMMAVGPGYFSATLPAERVVSPQLEYFVEATRESGESMLIAGSPDKPIVTTVYAVPHAAPPLRHDSSLTVWTDLADYNRWRGNDRVWQTEGTFAMRFTDVGVRALRSGFGVYRGVGGSVAELDDPKNPRDPRSVGLTYGHLEGEFGIKPAVSLIVRAVLGLGDDGTSGGGQLHLRVGSDLSTNLSIGGEVLGGVGLRGITQLEIEPRGRVPILIRSEVTNQPAGTGSDQPTPGLIRESHAASDIGVRGIVQVGYRVVDSLVLALRASYQGRTIDHAGPGFGGAVEYRW